MTIKSILLTGLLLIGTGCANQAQAFDLTSLVPTCVTIFVKKTKIKLLTAEYRYLIMKEFKQFRQYVALFKKIERIESCPICSQCATCQEKCKKYANKQKVIKATIDTTEAQVSARCALVKKLFDEVEKLQDNSGN